MRIAFEPATEDDAARMAPRLRQADQDELSALSNRSHDVTLRLSIQMSDEPMLITADGDPVALFGVARASLLSTTGVPWLLGTDLVGKLARPLLPLSALVLASWRGKYPHMENHVSVHHHQSLRWLKWLGFTLHPAEPYGQFGKPFHKFEMRSG